MRLELTDEEKDALLERIFAAAKEDLLKQVEYTLKNEIQAGVRSYTRTAISRRIMELVDPIIEEKKAKLEERARAIADGMVRQAEDAVRMALSGSPYGDFGTRLANTITEALRGVGNSVSSAVLSALKTEKKEGTNG